MRFSTIALAAALATLDVLLSPLRCSRNPNTFLQTKERSSPMSRHTLLTTLILLGTQPVLAAEGEKNPPADGPRPPCRRAVG